MTKAKEEKNIYIAYNVSLLLKFIQASLEVVSALFLYFVSTNRIINFLVTITHSELIEEPNNFIANFLVNNANHITSTGKLFIVYYLLSHGIIKVAIITGLYLRKAWAYPASLVGLGGLIIYQIYHIFKGHSILLIVLTVMDIIILWLIWREHQIKKYQKPL